MTKEADKKRLDIQFSKNLLSELKREMAALNKRVKQVRLLIKKEQEFLQKEDQS